MERPHTCQVNDGDLLNFYPQATIYIIVSKVYFQLSTEIRVWCYQFTNRILIKVHLDDGNEWDCVTTRVISSANCNEILVETKRKAINHQKFIN